LTLLECLRVEVPRPESITAGKDGSCRQQAHKQRPAPGGDHRLPYEGEVSVVGIEVTTRLLGR